MRSALVLILIMVVLTGCNLPLSPATPAPAPTTALAATQVNAATTPSTPQTVTQPTTAAPNTAQASSGWISYLGADGNLWLANVAQGEQKQLTKDAAPFSAKSKNDTVDYCCASWSWDGRLLAYERHLGKPVENGLSYTSSLLVYDIASGQTRALLENQTTSGFAWRPLTHLLTYSLPVDPKYFDQQGKPVKDQAHGIWAIDADSGKAPFELIKPLRGYSMVNPRWSRDGLFVGFEEVMFIEGRGNFGFYDMQKPAYHAWEKAIGGYDWSPDSKHIAHDNLNYAPSGNEDIWVITRERTDERQLSPNYEIGYSYYPVYSPKGDQIAYLHELGQAGKSTFKVVVQPVQGGQPRELATFEQPGSLSWSPDGQNLLLDAGPFENRQVIEIKLADGSSKTLVKGSFPAWQPAGH